MTSWPVTFIDLVIMLAQLHSGRCTGTVWHPGPDQVRLRGRGGGPRVPGVA